MTNASPLPNGRGTAIYRDALCAAFGKHFSAMAVLRLPTGCATVLKSDVNSAFAGRSCPWDDLLRRYAARGICEEDRARFLQALSREALTEFAASDAKKLSLGFRRQREKNAFAYLELSVSALDAAGTLLVTTRDISEEKLTQSILSQFLYRTCDYLALLDTRRDAYSFYAISESGAPLPSGSAACYTEEMTRYNRRYVVPEDVARVTANMQIPHILKKLERLEEYSFTCGLLTESGNYCRMRLCFTYYDEPAGLVLLMRSDITLVYLEEKALNEQLVAVLREAQTDPLTGLYNKKTVSDLVARYLTCQDRRTAALLFIDVDNFKQINDTLGHLKGDEFLRFLAGAFRTMAGPRDIYGRIGGDEFLFYLPNAASRADIEAFAERVCRIFCALEKNFPSGLSVSCSVGIAVYPQDGANYETLLYKADQALYTAKRYGKNTYFFFSEGMENRCFPSMLSSIDRPPDA